jgi:hypothetical protein
MKHEHASRSFRPRPIISGAELRRYLLSIGVIVPEAQRPMLRAYRMHHPVGVPMDDRGRRVAIETIAKECADHGVKINLSRVPTWLADGFQKRQAQGATQCEA